MEPREYKLMYQQEENYWWFTVKRFFIKQYLSAITLKKTNKVLDIGCGTGLNLQLLSEYGKVWGMDFSALALNFCRKRGFKRLYQGSVEKIPFKNNNFKLVTLFDVLYHKKIKDDLLVLKEIYRVLEKGGYLLLTDCAFNFLFGPHDINVHARQRYTKKELEEKLIKAGFKIKKSSYIFFFFFLPFAFCRLYDRYITKKNSHSTEISLLINKIIINIGRLEAGLLSITNFPFGSSIIVLAQK